MPTIKIRTLPISRAQKKFRESKAWMTGFVGGRGSGKTKIGAIHIARSARKDDPCMCVSPDANMIRDTTLPTFIETVKFTGQYIRHVTTPTPRVLFYTEDGGVSELMFKGAEVPDKLRGPSKAILWFDEASIISKEAFDYGIAVCRHRGRMSPVLCTFTPRGFRHWTFESFYEPIDERIFDQIGNDGSSLDGIEWFKGKPYRPKANTHLIFCATKDNPFAPREFASIIGGNYSQLLREQEIGGQYVEISGLMFRREWFRMVDEAPANATRIRYWDKASTPGDGCYSAGVLMARDDRGTYYVEDVVRGQWGAHERNTVILQTAQRDAWKYRGSVSIYIEQEGAGSGKEVTDQLIVMLSEFPVYRDLASGSAQGFKLKGGVRLPGDAKIRRAQPFSAQAEAGNVRIVNGRFVNDFLDELTSFPEYKFCDQVDAASACQLKLASQAPDGIHASQDIVASGIDYGLLGSLGGNSAERYLEHYSQGAKRSYDVDPRELLSGLSDSNDSSENDFFSSHLPWNR